MPFGESNCRVERPKDQQSKVSFALENQAQEFLGARLLTFLKTRCVTDTTLFSLHIATLTAFAVAIALNVALAPGMTALLDRMDEFDFYLPFLNEKHFNGMIGSGYFMALNWFVYTLYIVIFFGKPKQSGLDELREREASFASNANQGSLLEKMKLATKSKDMALDPAILRKLCHNWQLCGRLLPQ